jgi:hypothetical protein
MCSESTRIAELNDRLRTTLAGGRIVMTAGVNALGPMFCAMAVAQLRAFNTFGPANDPHGEHDFGQLQVDGHELFWKIDYYDPTLTWHSANAADPSLTVRVLTLMLAEEY